ncbi:hypothetical protein AALP_AA4G116700 [Arabis alpina]|uniref:ATPase AAA-type core domain-containing protein n=1 Tax=Arabis alpina TaxID=50452 RepID=A0A087H2N1_ARAAL|nr:hypothetical protein AALP_AA4G116700 [Arabis alpina]
MNISAKLGRLSVGSKPVLKVKADDFLSSGEGGKNDYDWLLTPLGTPLGSDSHSSLAAPKITPSARASSASKASRMARSKKACIVFFDEVDAIGGARFDDGVGGDNEVQRTMLEIVNQLDGFDNIKIIDLCGIKESDTGLAPPSQWDLVSDKQMMQEEQPLQVVELPMLHPDLMCPVKRNQVMRWVLSRQKEMSDACGGSGLVLVD